MFVTTADPNDLARRSEQKATLVRRLPIKRRKSFFLQLKGLVIRRLYLLHILARRKWFASDAIVVDWRRRSFS